MLGMKLHAPAGACRDAGVAHGNHGCPLGWTLDPLLTVPLGLALLIYLVGWLRLSKRASRAGRGPALFLSGWLVLALSLVSPLHEAGERSFTMHMIEHELIMLVATLLLAASSAGGVLAWGLPRPLRQRARRQLEVAAAALWKRLTEPVTATAIQARRDVGVARAAPVRPGARQLRLAHRPARLLLPELAALLVGDAAPARSAARLWRLRGLPVRDLADRRRARRADELFVVAPGMPIMRRWA